MPSTRTYSSALKEQTKLLFNSGYHVYILKYTQSVSFWTELRNVAFLVTVVTGLGVGGA